MSRLLDAIKMITNEDFIGKGEEIFCVAVTIHDGHDRTNYLDQACAGDPQMRAIVETLLAAHAAGERIVSACQVSGVIGRDTSQAVAHDPSVRRSLGLEPFVDEMAGTWIGKYKLIEVLGHGGCGVVHLAIQQEPVYRQVALKILKLGMDTRSVIARFESERQALAIMDHPNIARVIDAGATDAGRPYFVMDLVQGVPITRFCDEQRLNVLQRLELFIQVCTAIQHAHQKGIIHRDIKPSNVLVAFRDGCPKPVVIDFGISTAVGGRLAEQTIFTCHEHFIGTPHYMSPEQAQSSRLDVDTRSDVYSLGVLLYELTTGRTPFDPATLLDAGVDEMRRTLLEREVPRPSTLLRRLAPDILNETAWARSDDPNKLVARLRGDLDWIATKALEKDRDRRYQTANGLAMDVRRHLDGDPVLARPPSRLYRLQKLIRRNRLVFTLGSLIALLLIAALASTSALLIRERELRREQGRLRASAERELAAQAGLRRQAEWRKGLGEAAALIYRNDMEGADRLVSALRGPAPVPEGAYVLRTLGEWNAIGGRWTVAREQYQILLSANRLDDLDMASLDLLATAVSILKSGDERGYRSFCHAVANSFRGATDPMVVDRVLKSCLLRPVSGDLKEALSSFAAVADSHTRRPDYPLDDIDLIWRCQSMALWSLRNGQYGEAMGWADRVLAVGDEPRARASGAHAIRAMAAQLAGKQQEAQDNLKQARDIVRIQRQAQLSSHDGSAGFWFDWIISEVLLEEAEQMDGSSSLGPRYSPLMCYRL